MSKDKVDIDPLQQRLRTQAYSTLRAAIQSNDGVNPLAQVVVKRLMEKVSKAREDYFSRPVVTLPFSVSGSAMKRVAACHPELREINYLQHRAVPDELYKANKYLSVRRSLVNVLRSHERLKERPFEHQLLLDGIQAHEHQFVFRAKLSIVQLGPQWVDVPLKALLVADLTASRYSFRELCEMARLADAYEALFLLPYVPEMWTRKGSVTKWGYAFEWTFPGSTTGRVDLAVYPLPDDFFRSVKYSEYKLYVQAFGSSKAFVLSRADFIALFYSEIGDTEFVEMRSARNGFAEVSAIGFKDKMFDVDSVVREVEAEPLPPRGTIRLSGPVASVVSMPIFGMAYNLAQPEPVYAPLSNYRRGERQLLSMDIGRAAVNAVVRTFHAYSASIVRDGAILRVENMVHPEVIALMTECAVAQTKPMRRQMSKMDAEVRIAAGGTWDSVLRAFVRWVVHSAVSSTDIDVAVKQVLGFVRGEHGAIGIVDQPVQFLPYVSSIDAAKQEGVDRIVEYAHDLLGPVPEGGYQIKRAEVSASKQQMFELSAEMIRRRTRVMSLSVAQTAYDQCKVAIEGRRAVYDVDSLDLQMVYDDVFPGVSLMDPTMRQLQNELSPASYVVDTAWFSCSIPAMFSVLEGYHVLPSRLRTAVGADHMHSFRQLMASLIKRNFNRPRPEIAGDRGVFAREVVRHVVKKYGRRDTDELLATFALMSITVSREAIEVWAEKHPVADVIAACTMLESAVYPNPSTYRVMPKSSGKPPRSTGAASSLTVGQTVVYHTKDMIALTVGMFTLALTRLSALFNDNIMFATAADEHNCGIWADKYLDKGHVYEFDIPKYDKSQDWACFEIVLYTLQLVGVSAELLDYWRKASDYGYASSAMFKLAFETLQGNKSGNGGTLPINCMTLLFAMLECLSRSGTRVIAVLIKGDDMVLVTVDRVPMSFYEYMETLFGLSTKPVEGSEGTVAFCSAFFVRDMNDHYMLVRDPVGLLEKLGKALSLDNPSTYFLDYYASLVDATIPYSDPVVVRGLVRAVTLRYGVVIDVETIVQYLMYVTSDIVVFLTEMYDIDISQVKELESLDLAAEVLIRSRSGRFQKAKDLADQYGSVRKSLIDSSRMLQDYWFSV